MSMGGGAGSRVKKLRESDRAKPSATVPMIGSSDSPSLMTAREAAASSIANRAGRGSTILHGQGDVPQYDPNDKGGQPESGKEKWQTVTGSGGTAAVGDAVKPPVDGDGDGTPDTFEDDKGKKDKDKKNKNKNKKGSGAGYVNTSGAIDNNVRKASEDAAKKRLKWLKDRNKALAAGEDWPPKQGGGKKDNDKKGSSSVLSGKSNKDKDKDKKNKNKNNNKKKGGKSVLGG